MNSSDVTAVLDRLKEHFGVTKDAELARELGTSPQTLSSWRQRNSIPYAMCVDLSMEQGVSLDWLLYGEGNRLRSSSANRNPDPEFAALTLGERATAALAALSPDDLEAIKEQTENEIRIRALEGKYEELLAHVRSMKNE